MYQKGDYVIYGCKGVCRIVEVTTLNMDETVARGCALQCAILSPRMRVKPYDIVDRIT